MPFDHEAEARQIFAANGLEAGRLVPAAGVANRVLLSEHHVLRLNEGRFRGAFAFEAEVLERLPASVPHPGVAARGARAGRGEYLLLTRLPGHPLTEEPAGESASVLRSVIADLARVVAELHRLPVAGWMSSVWVAEALGGRWADAYHAPPQLHADLVTAARTVRPEAMDLFDDVGAFLTELVNGPSACFDTDEPQVFCHTDLHPGNVMVSDGTVSGLIDFEGARVAPADTELDMLLRSIRHGGQGLPGGPARGREVLTWFIEGYPAIAAHPRLVDRLLVYEGLWQLVQCHHWREGARFAPDPVVELGKVIDGSRKRQVSALLGD